MKRFRIAVLLLCASGAAALAQDPLKLAPQYYKVEIDNEQVRVLRAKRPPHTQVAMHEHPDYITIYLTDLHQKISTPGGAPQDVTRKKGEVAFSKATKHDEDNISDQPLEVLVIEPKPGAKRLADVRPDTLDPVKIDPKHHKVQFENDRVRVIRLLREPHAKIPMHQHVHYVSVALTDVNSKQTLPDGKVIDTHRKAGDVDWRDPVTHSVENLGDAQMEEIQVEFK